VTESIAAIADASQIALPAPVSSASLSGIPSRPIQQVVRKVTAFVLEAPRMPTAPTSASSPIEMRCPSRATPRAEQVGGRETDAWRQSGARLHYRRCQHAVAMAGATGSPRGH
jgi:hypothetical protein